MRLLGLPAEAIRDLADGRVVSVERVEVAWPEHDRRVLGYRRHALTLDPGAAPQRLVCSLPPHADLARLAGIPPLTWRVWLSRANQTRRLSVVRATRCARSPEEAGVEGQDESTASNARA